MRILVACVQCFSSVTLTTPGHSVIDSMTATPSRRLTLRQIRSTIRNFSIQLSQSVPGYIQGPSLRTVTAASRLVAATDWSWIASRSSFENLGSLEIHKLPEQ
jgi:hypothetical protein